MSNAGKWIRQALGWSGVLIAVALSFPVLALVVVVFRAVVLPLVMVAVLACAVVYCSNNRFRCWAYRMVRGSEVHHRAVI